MALACRLQHDLSANPNRAWIDSLFILSKAIPGKAGMSFNSFLPSLKKLASIYLVLAGRLSLSLSLSLDPPASITFFPHGIDRRPPSSLIQSSATNNKK
jgi:hypothetical protein